MACGVMRIEDIAKAVMMELENSKKSEKKESEFRLEEMEKFGEKSMNYPDIKGEAEFLNSLKERILVLFEGLNSFDKGDIEARVELNLKFMEFLLASIENRLEHLSK